MSRFSHMLAAAQQTTGSLLCVGLDPQPERLPRHLGDDPSRAVVDFIAGIVEATSDFACAYKPNMAYFEALGRAGWPTLEASMQRIRALAPETPIILDAKRGDIGISAEAYAIALFEQLGADACTVSPYMGADSVAPFCSGDRFAFILCRTSNPGAHDVQDMLTQADASKPPVPLYLELARQACLWANAEHSGFVVGATAPAQLTEVAQVAPDRILLIPGVGAQGADASATMAALGASAERAIITVSRQILYADSGPTYAVAAHAVAAQLAAQLAMPRRVAKTTGPMEFRIDDIVRLRKPHPCGGYEWRVYRLGADIGLRCQKCGHPVLLTRSLLEKRLKKFVERGPESAITTEAESLQ